MRFMTPDEALAHSTGDNHATDKKLYQCTVPNCRLAVVGIVLAENEVQKHWQGHVDREHVSSDAKLVYRPVEPRPSKRLPLFDIIYQFGIDLAMSSDQDSNEDSNDQTELIEVGELDYEEPWSLDPEEDCGKDFAGIDLDQLFSKEHCATILAQNTTYFEDRKHLKFNLHARGRTCGGPGLGTKWLITEPCPFGVIIDLDTARLRPSRVKSPPSISLDLECVACHATKHTREILKKFDTRREGLGMVNYKLLQKTFLNETRKQWTVTPEFSRVEECIREIENDERPGTDCVVLDDEFTIVGSQLMEFAIIECVSGKTLVNTLVEHPGGIKHVSTKREASVWEKTLSRIQEKGVYSRSRNLDRLNVHEIARKIKASGITSKSLILVWHTSRFDLRLLRNFLSQGGYDDILPGDENCFTLVQQFRLNLPKIGKEKKMFPLRLEILFPTMFPRSKLVGRNHQALIDVFQTRLVFMGLIDLRRALKERDMVWEPEKIEKPECHSLLEFFPLIKGPKSSQRIKQSEDTGSEVSFKGLKRLQECQPIKAAVKRRKFEPTSDSETEEEL
ncbi:hypothetical protein H9Q70_010552 [Fusarium xylarioides]|nr:hypothetical protein H9Q70_010552 [Fusarium xylarioides]